MMKANPAGSESARDLAHSKRWRTFSALSLVTCHSSLIFTPVSHLPLDATVWRREVKLVTGYPVVEE